MVVAEDLEVVEDGVGVVVEDLVAVEDMAVGEDLAAVEDSEDVAEDSVSGDIFCFKRLKLFYQFLQIDSTDKSEADDEKFKIFFMYNKHFVLSEPIILINFSLLLSWIRQRMKRITIRSSDYLKDKDNGRLYFVLEECAAPSLLRDIVKAIMMRDWTMQQVRVASRSRSQC